MEVKYQISELRALVLFVRACGYKDIKGFIKHRMDSMGMSLSDTMDDLITSGIDLMIDRIYKQPYSGFQSNQ